jgi:hypothetical protein
VKCRSRAETAEGLLKNKQRTEPLCYTDLNLGERGGLKTGENQVAQEREWALLTHADLCLFTCHHIPS